MIRNLKNLIDLFEIYVIILFVILYYKMFIFKKIIFIKWFSFVLNTEFFNFKILTGVVIIMFVQEVTIQNQVGLHARPATFFIQKANEYKSSIWIEKEGRRVNAKSLLGVLSLGIIGGTVIKVIADGPDEQESVEGLVALVESGFAS